MHKIVIGVVPEHFDVSPGHCIGESQSVGYIARSGHKVGGGGSEAVHYGVPYAKGDRVGVLADPIKNEVSFFLNGVWLGVAFTGSMDIEARSYQFAASLARGHMKLRLATTAKCPPMIQPPSPSILGDLMSRSTRQALANIEELKRSYPSGFDPADLQILRIPRDVMQTIFGKLNFNELRDCMTVCREWARTASADYVWRPIALRLTPVPETLLDPAYTSYRTAVMRKALRFSPAVHAPGLELSNDGLTVTSSSAVTYWAAIRLDYPVMDSGVHYAEFHIDVFRHGSIGNTWKLACGIVSDEFEFELTKWVGVDGKSFGYIASNGKSVGPASKNLGAAYAEGYQENDRIGVLIDFPADQITFYKNGVNLGVAFEEFSKAANLKEDSKYYFGVSLARFGMQISVVPNAVCPDRHISAH